jgi:competence protein ComEA
MIIKSGLMLELIETHPIASLASFCKRGFVVGNMALIALAQPLAAQSKQAQLPDGPGKEVTQRVCSACHGVEIVMGRGLTRDGWTAVVSDMVDRGAQGTDDDFGQVVDYLAKNFPPKPDGEKKPNAAAKK